jgi:hypothetical protein
MIHSTYTIRALLNASALSKGPMPKETCGNRIKTIRSALVSLPVFVGAGRSRASKGARLVSK